MVFTSSDGFGDSSENSAPAAPRTILNGMKAICAHLGKSEPTVRRLVKSEGLPASKEGGEWVSDEGAIHEWRLARMRAESAERAGEAQGVE